MRFEHRMSDADALMWSIEKDPVLRSTITAVAILDRSPDPERLRHLVDRASRLVPRMRQRVRSNPASVAPPRWEVDPHFNLDYHLRRVRAGGDASVRSVLDLAAPVAMSSFDRARPLWEFTVVDDLADGHSALVLKVHHAITDGIGAMQIALVLFELEREPAQPPGMPAAPAAEVMGQVRRFADALDHERRRNLGIAKRVPSQVTSTLRGAITDPVGSANRLGAAAGSAARMMAPATEPRSSLMTDRSLSIRFDTLRVPLAETRAAAKRAGGRLNDAFVAATARAFARYHRSLGDDARELRMSMPINIRTDETADAAGNQFVPARFPIPVAIDDPIEHMTAIRDLVAAQRAEPSLGLVNPMARVLNRLPTSVSTGVFGSMLKGVDLVTSNVPGAPMPIYLAGAEVDQLFAFGPMTGAAANVTLLSYQDDLALGITTDPGAVTDPELLVECHRKAFDDLIGAGA